MALKPLAKGHKPASRESKIARVSPQEMLHLVKDAGISWNTDGAASMGAAIAFYTIFSIAPLLIITMAIAGFFFGADAAQGQIYSQARSLLGEEGAAALQGLIQSASRPTEGFLATLVGLLFMIFGATAVFAELQGAMDRIWQAPVKEYQAGIWYLLRRRILTFGILLAVAFLLLVSLTISALISALQSLWITRSDEVEMAWQAINFAVSFVIIAGLFALLFKLLPRVSVAWGDVIIGAGASGGISDVGNAFVWYGSALGLGPNGTPENANWSATGSANLTYMGSDVASAGDVNGDGYDDVIIGADQYTNGQTFEGGAFVWYGSASGLGPNGTPQNADWSAETDQTSAGGNGKVGAAGDVNGDGYDDIIMGFLAYNSFSGVVLVWYGSASGLGPNGTPANADWRADGQGASSLGTSVSTAGDVNGDGYSDVIVGAEDYDNGQNNEGGAFLWYGGPSGLGSNGTPANADWRAEADSAEARLGSRVANAGDVEGSGFSSVIISGFCYVRPQTCVARAFVWFGSATGLGPNGTSTNADWNNTYQRIWKGKLSAAEIQTELDTLQTTIEGYVTKTG